MKHSFLLLLSWLGLLLLAPAAKAAPVPAVPATLDVAGLHLSLTDEARELIRQRAAGLVRHEPSFRARVALADACFPIIDRVLRAEGVPVEFRYLALQESALLGNAESAHGAVGYWQIKRETALSLGLRVDDAVDERRHLTASTRAAARYLRQNQATTQNWLLALLSYQTGLGGVRAYQLPTDAGATQMSITADTHPYLLMFLAQQLVFEPVCGLNPAPALTLREFPATAGQTLAKQAVALGLDPAELARHNPWLRHPDQPVPATGGPYTLLVPITGPAQLAALARRPGAADADKLLGVPALAEAIPGGRAVTAQAVQINGLDALIALPGEDAAALAERAGVRLSQLLRDNDLEPLDAVVPGWPYFLARKRDEAATDYHVLRPGEDLAAVSQKYGIQRRAIRQKNRLEEDEVPRPGRVLWLRHLRPREVDIEYRDPAEAAALERRARRGTAPGAGSAPSSAPVVRRPKAAGSSPASAAAAPAASAPVAVASASAQAAVVVSTPATAPRRVPPPLPPPAPLPPAAPVADEPASAEATQATPARPAPVVGDVLVRPVVVVAAPAPPAPAPTVGITVPVAGPAAVGPAAIAAIAVPEAIPASGFYRVQARETVYGLARRFALRPADLLTWNRLPPGAGLQLGQLLRLRAPAAAPKAAATGADIPPPATSGRIP